MFVQKQNFGVNDRLQFNFQLNTYNYPLHIHQFAELCYLIDGSLEVTVNDRVLTLHAGDYLFIAPLSVHGYSTPERCDAVVMAFPTSLLPEAVTINSFSAGHRSDAPDAAVYFESLFVRGGLGTPAFAPADNDQPSHMRLFYIDLAGQRQFIRVRSALGALLAECSENSDKPTGDTDALAKLLRWLGRHFTEPVTLSDAASTLGYSEKYAGRMIKERLGASFSELLLSYKLQKAAQLMADTDLPIDEIAREAGYNNPSGLYKQFFASYGMTPSAYRKMTE